ncbi:unnamed protein product [Owenia fusiformis]|uniref:Uncharacterized protein n=1 Tax=Owenia fusiformis TaxID=6347 RepID=A0A8S4PB70_OWEFU|nr:unnamed protein product [Owenia fusiformis]
MITITLIDSYNSSHLMCSDHRICLMISEHVSGETERCYEYQNDGYWAWEYFGKCKHCEMNNSQQDDFGKYYKMVSCLWFVKQCYCTGCPESKDTNALISIDLPVVR